MCSFRRKPAWSEPMAMRKWCSPLRRPDQSTFGGVEETLPSPIPRVTPWLLQQADTMCPRRLWRDHEGSPRSHDPVHRSRMREPFVARLREIHAQMRAPMPGDFDGSGSSWGTALEPEEQA